LFVCEFFELVVDVVGFCVVMVDDDVWMCGVDVDMDVVMCVFDFDFGDVGVFYVCGYEFVDCDVFFYVVVVLLFWFGG